MLPFCQKTGLQPRIIQEVNYSAWWPSARFGELHKSSIYRADLQGHGRPFFIHLSAVFSELPRIFTNTNSKCGHSKQEFVSMYCRNLPVVVVIKKLIAKSDFAGSCPHNCRQSVRFVHRVYVTSVCPCVQRRACVSLSALPHLYHPSGQVTCTLAEVPLFFE